MFTDVDFLIYSESDIETVLIKAGYKKSVFTEYFDGKNKHKFSCYRKGKVNLIVSSDRGMIDRHRVATDVCKRWNIRTKATRVSIHCIIRDGAPIDDLGYIRDPALGLLLKNLSGPDKATILKTYMVQHGMLSDA